jgi:hypothetical protein
MQAKLKTMAEQSLCTNLREDNVVVILAHAHIHNSQSVAEVPVSPTFYEQLLVQKFQCTLLVEKELLLLNLSRLYN